VAECVKLKPVLLAEAQKIIPIFNYCILNDDIILFSVEGDIIHKDLNMS
jgi:hypothetical protein